MSVAEGIDTILRANSLSFPLTLTVRTLCLKEGVFHTKTATAQTLQEVVDIAGKGNGAKITTQDGVVLFPPGGVAASPVRFRMHLPDTLKGHLDQ